MTETMRDVLAEPVEIEGSLFVMTRPRGHVTGSGQDYFLGGGYVVGIRRYTTGTAEVELRQCGPDTPLLAGSFDSYDDARNEFERLKSVLILRDRVRFMIDLAERGDVLPAEFLANVRAGDVESLAIAADFQDDRGEADKALILRAAYYHLTGQGSVAVKASKKTTVVYDAGVAPSAAVIVPGESIRIVSLVEKIEELPHGMPGTRGLVRRVVVKEFAVGDQAEYGSYNLTYYGPVKSITAKTVVVSERCGDPRIHRLKIADFVSKNRDFDLAIAQKRNSEWSD